MGMGCRIYRELNFALAREVGACETGMFVCVKHKDMATFAKISQKTLGSLQLQ